MHERVAALAPHSFAFGITVGMFAIFRVWLCVLVLLGTVHVVGIPTYRLQITVHTVQATPTAAVVES